MGFLKRIGKEKAYVVLNTYYAYFAMGIATIMLGSVLPAMKAEYALDYTVGGFLLSMTSVGYSVFGLAAGFLPAVFGLKRSFILVTAPMSLGLALMLLTGNPVLLLIAMFMIGINKGGVANYNNLIVSAYSGGDGGPLNFLHATFAVGACIAPIAVLLFSGIDASGWRWAVAAAAIVTAIGVILMLPMRLEDIRGTAPKNGSAPASFGFLHERIFWVSTLINFLYQAIEASLMGWLTSFAVDSGLMSDSSALLVTSALWISLLVGRLGCSILSRKIPAFGLLPILAAAQLVFAAFLANSTSFTGMLIATIGLGLGMSGMYGTSVSNAGDLFSRYPVCMGFFVMLTSMGAVIMPAVIGAIANVSSLRSGFVLLIFVAVLLVAATFYNFCRMRK